MNKDVEKLFPKTKEANVVQKWFGVQIGTYTLLGVLAKGKEKEILAAANELEEAEKKEEA